MKIKSLSLALAICFLAASTANAQFGGGHGGRGGGGQAPSGPPSGGGGPPPGKVVPPDQVDIIGVVQSIDTATDRITIHYQPVDALDWQAGTTPFVVAKSSLLKGITVGEKVRFRLESQQIYVLQPFAATQGAGPPPTIGPH